MQQDLCFVTGSEEKSKIFEIWMVRGIFGPVKIETGLYRISRRPLNRPRGKEKYHEGEDIVRVTKTTICR